MHSLNLHVLQVLQVGVESFCQRLDEVKVDVLG